MKLRSIYPVVLVPVVSGLLIVALLWLFLSPFTHAAPRSGRVPLGNSVAAYTSKSRLLVHATANQPMTLAIGLSLRNQADLAAYLQQVTTPHSPLYHHYLNPASFAALYGPLPASEAAIVQFLRADGLTITNTYANHLVVDVAGTVARVEQAFQVHINNYRSADGLTYYANDTTPSLSTELAPLVATLTSSRPVQRDGIPLVTERVSRFVESCQIELNY